ncbi:MAG: glycosyltransferase family 2 protein [Chitinophagaceae bacterium]|nr:glycosyltransferase family 2 protein [Chitinophagaceae bacterium]
MAEISIIVPVYNEVEHILPLYYELKKHLPQDFELLWVDDGSTDDSLAEIEQLSMRDARIKCIILTRNFGQKSAVSAGFDFANGNTIVVMDGDLKHPPSTIPAMLEKISAGYEIVNAINTKHAKTFRLQRMIMDGYYSFLNRINPGSNDNDITTFRALNHKVIDGIYQLKEKNLLIDSFFSWAGYKTCSVDYVCVKCKQKKKKYSRENLWYETVKTINSLKPSANKVIFVSGFVTLLAAVAGLYQTLMRINSNMVTGNSAVIILLVLFAGSIALLLGSKRQKGKKTNSREKRTPQYLIKDIIEQDERSAYQFSTG